MWIRWFISRGLEKTFLSISDANNCRCLSFLVVTDWSERWAISLDRITIPIEVDQGRLSSLELFSCDSTLTSFLIFFTHDDCGLCEITKIHRDQRSPLGVSLGFRSLFGPRRRWSRRRDVSERHKKIFADRSKGMEDAWRLRIPKMH